MECGWVLKCLPVKIFAFDKHSAASVIIVEEVFAQQLNDISSIGWEADDGIHRDDLPDASHEMHTFDNKATRWPVRFNLL